MSRESLRFELAAYEPADARERAMVAELSAFIGTYADCFERRLTIGHVTASAWVVDADATHALLTHHRKLGRWLQLGGHADGDPDVRRVAMREACEESGLRGLRFARDGIYDIDVHVIPARANEPEHRHYDVRFAIRADRNEPVRASEESHELAWRPIVELDRDGVDESVRRLARKSAMLDPRAATATIITQT